MQIEYIDAGTPITNTHYIGAPKGEIYGADHSISRFDPELNITVRAQTPLKNLYLTGVCVNLCVWNIQTSSQCAVIYFACITLDAFVSQARMCFCAVSPVPSPELSLAALPFSSETSIWMPSPWQRGLDLLIPS